jgi:type II secretory pathway component PulF
VASGASVKPEMEAHRDTALKTMAQAVTAGSSVAEAAAAIMLLKALVGVGESSGKLNALAA